MIGAGDPARIYAQAIDALNRRDWGRAQALASGLLAHVPGHAGVHFVVGVASLQLQHVPRADAHLRKAVELNPKRADYATQWARLLASTHRLREAVVEAERAFSLGPGDPLTLDTLGVIFTQAHAHERAAEVFRRAVSMLPDRASFRFNLATSLTFIGDLDAAADEYEACLRLEPGYWKAHLALSQLRKQTSDRNHIDRLHALLVQRVSDPEALLYLNLALEKEYDDLGEYQKAFECLTTGKAAWSKTLGYRSERDEALFEALIQACPEPQVASTGFDNTEAIFVIGMPRTGTTLVDRILSSHPQVHSAGELSNFGVALKRASGSMTAPLIDVDTVRRARSVDLRKLGEAYVSSTRPGTGSMPHFIDKLPHNFLYAGFIAQALPYSRIICLRREATDTCLSNFRQLFALKSPYYDYSFDLLDTGRYYLMFERLMAHWRRVLPDRILEIRYEDIIDKQEDSTRRLLDHCGLPWDDACMRFEENAAPVATASVVQVRSPIYRSSLQRWKRYGPRLDGLRRLLREGGIEME